MENLENQSKSKKSWKNYSLTKSRNLLGRDAWLKPTYGLNSKFLNLAFANQPFLKPRWKFSRFLSRQTRTSLVRGVPVFPVTSLRRTLGCLALEACRQQPFALVGGILAMLSKSFLFFSFIRTIRILLFPVFFGKLAKQNPGV